MASKERSFLHVFRLKRVQKRVKTSKRYVTGKGEVKNLSRICLKLMYLALVTSKEGTLCRVNEVIQLWWWLGSLCLSNLSLKPWNIAIYFQFIAGLAKWLRRWTWNPPSACRRGFESIVICLLMCLLQGKYVGNTLKLKWI